MARLPDPPRDASKVPVEGFVKRSVWGVLFVLGSFALLGAASQDAWRADWVLGSGPVLAVGILILVFARRHRMRVRAIFSLGKEADSEVVQITTVYRNGLVVGWQTTFRLRTEPGGDVIFMLHLNPAAVPFTLLVHEGRVGAYGTAEGMTRFSVRRLP